MVFQPINDLAEVCARYGIKDAILSPGSRCAPLTLAFARHPEISVKTFSDERSAGFIALGMASKLKVPSILICTSGTAVLNYGPAVAESFYQHVPLIILTADRPPELIDQQDGQTIRQRGVFGKHVKRSYHLPVEYDLPHTAKYVNRVINEALNLAVEYPAGPVHINIPFREPFFPDPAEPFEYSGSVPISMNTEKDFDLSEKSWAMLRSKWRGFDKILVVAGQSDPNETLKKDLSSLSKQIPVVGDILSNLHSIPQIISHSDLILSSRNNEFKHSLKPELLITFGNSTISKNLKIYLRKNKPEAHWHIQPAGHAADTYQSITRIIRTTPVKFFNQVSKWLQDLPYDHLFCNSWYNAETNAKRMLSAYLPDLAFGELRAVANILNNLSFTADIHLANSMPVRLANYIGLSDENMGTKVYSNRGTSGIDGSNGAAVGQTLVSKNPVFLITGDLAFFYDRNAFWHNYDISRLHIVLLNNHSGGIFGVIDGPSGQPELEEYFETNQKLTAENTARDFGFEYVRCSDIIGLEKIIGDFIDPGTKPKLLEIETDNRLNKKILTAFRNYVAEEIADHIELLPATTNE